MADIWSIISALNQTERPSVVGPLKEGIVFAGPLSDWVVVRCDV